MRVLVTGANGMLGIDLCQLLEAAGHEVIRTDVGVREGMVVPAWETLDITDTKQVQESLHRHRPDAVIHGAAYTNVDGAERDMEAACRINVLGTWNIAAVCSDLDTRLYYISTDFVFDGEKKAPYTELDAPNPINHYGKSKQAGERIVESICRRHFICRTSWLFGVHGPSFPAKMIELSRTRSELSVVVDQIGSPTHTLDLSRTLIRLLDSPLYGIYHITNKGQCSWYEFACKALELAGAKRVTVHPIPASQWASPTKRPAYSVLRHYALELQGLDDLPHWETALQEFIQRLPR